MTAIAATVQAFFTERLITQRQASPHTIAAYRDVMRMLLSFTAKRTKIACHRLEFTDLDAPAISAFLDHLEDGRSNSVRTRNARLAAIHSLFAFAALRHPEHATDISRVLAIPAKRGDHTIVTYLTDTEVQALLAAPNRQTRTGRRDHAILTLGIQTGLRASELTSLTCRDVHLGVGAHVHCRGKGRKDRTTPLTTSTISVLRAWMNEHAAGPGDPLFVTHPKRPSQPGRPRPTNRPARRRRSPLLPVAGQQKRHPPRASAHRRHALAARRGRHHRHRALARPRRRDHHTDLPRRRP